MVAETAPAFAYFFGMRKKHVYKLTLHEFNTHHEWAESMMKSGGR